MPPRLLLLALCALSAACMTTSSVQRVRLDRLLVQLGVGSRTEVTRIIRQGRVSVSGAATKSPSVKVDWAADDEAARPEIRVDDRVTQINGAPVGTFQSLEAVKEYIRTQETLMLHVERREVQLRQRGIRREARNHLEGVLFQQPQLAAALSSGGGLGEVHADIQQRPWFER